MTAKRLAALLLAALFLVPTLAAAVTLAGQVVAPDGQPVKEAMVLCAPSGKLNVRLPSDFMRKGFTDSEGRFALKDVSPGMLDIAVCFRGLEPRWLSGVAVTAGEPPPLQIKLARGSTLEGRILDGQGKPVPWAAVNASPAKGQPDWTDVLSTHADERGSYQLRGLPTGSFTLYTDSRERKLQGEASLKIDKEESRHLDLSFPAGVLVSGSVLDDNGLPISGVFVSLDPLHGYAFHTTTADDGSFSFPGVPEGEFRLHGKKQGLGETDAPLHIQVGDQPVSRQNRQMVPGGIITGRIQGLSPEEMSSSSVGAYLLKGGHKTVALFSKIDQRDFYQIEDAAPGTWMVRAGSGLKNNRHYVMVELPRAGMVVGVDIDLASPPEPESPEPEAQAKP